ncbi:hypothetical protein [Streptacidiphilus sp. PAMC 29251]
MRTNSDHYLIRTGPPSVETCLRLRSVSGLPHTWHGVVVLDGDEPVGELDRRAPAGAYVSLIADGEAGFLYEKFGFRQTAPASVGMYRVV